MRHSLIFLLLISSALVKGQLPADITHFYNKYSLKYRPSESGSINPFLITVIPKSIKPPVYLINGKYPQDTALNSKLFKISGDSTYLVSKIYNQSNICYDTTPVHVFLQGINRRNAINYEFRTLTNSGKIITDWTVPFDFLNGTYASGFGEDDPEMAHIGPLRSEWNSLIKIEIREKIGKKIICGTDIFWLAQKPEVLATFNSNQLNEFFKFLDFSSKNEASFNLWTEGKELEALAKEHTFFTDQNGIIFLLKDLVYKNIIEYRVISESYSNSPWKQNEFDFNFIWLKSLQPGKFKLQLRYSIQPENISEYEFEIKASWYQSGTFKAILGISFLTLAGLIFLYIKQRYQKRKLITHLKEKEKKALELRTIRSQLNPHFIFNALSSIQGLVNSNKTEEANKYLSEFSKLLRDTLSGNSKDYNSLQTELELMNRYLKLEQLRFGFNFKISVEPSVEISSIEVPSLLIQPLVENAVKHGVAELQQNGMIEIAVTKNKNDLSISIIDNGSGFNQNELPCNGLGIKLTRERIELLNQLNKLNPIDINFSKKENTMEANLTFKEIC